MTVTCFRRILDVDVNRNLLLSTSKNIFLNEKTTSWSSVSFKLVVNNPQWSMFSSGTIIAMTVGLMFRIKIQTSCKFFWQDVWNIVVYKVKAYNWLHHTASIKEKRQKIEKEYQELNHYRTLKDKHALMKHPHKILRGLATICSVKQENYGGRTFSISLQLPGATYCTHCWI